jgi:hypothetical protein
MNWLWLQISPAPIKWPEKNAAKKTAAFGGHCLNNSIAKVLRIRLCYMAACNAGCLQPLIGFVFNEE